ncbi:hypothetical protein J7I84_16950 [Arthrobacter sp. ISL-85]|nr:hypothetical protein [Arthrobacter sp. ISL-85]
MGEIQYDQFLSDATICDPRSGCNLAPDALYGLYTSWCHVTCRAPRPEKVFWSAMQSRVTPHLNGLRMTGAAATDYILSTHPALV